MIWLGLISTIRTEIMPKLALSGFFKPVPLLIKTLQSSQSQGKISAVQEFPLSIFIMGADIWESIQGGI